MFEQMNLFAQNALGDGSSGASDWRSGLLNLAVFVGAILIKISWNEVSKWVIIPFEVIDCVNICF